MVGLTLGTLAWPALGGWMIELAGYPAALALAGVVSALVGPLAPPRARAQWWTRKPGARHAVRTGVW